MKNIGVLWDDEVEWEGDKPFDYATDETYAYFSEMARDEEIDIFIAKYTWYDNGMLEKAWRFDGEWEKVTEVEIDGVHDKFLTNDETLELKREMADSPGIINDLGLEVLCKDKLETFREFSDYVPETRKASRKNIDEMMDEYGKIVLKPRTAYGAEGIHIVEKGEEVPAVDPEEYIVQRFIDSSGGINGMVDDSHDLRGIVVNGELRGAYVRYNEDSEISNVSEGGIKEAVDLEEFPSDAKEIVEKVIEELGYRPAIFSVDFFYDEEGEPWIVELNSKPGLNFFDDKQVKKQLTPIMRELVRSYKMLD